MYSDLEHLLTIQETIRDKGITSCFMGEIALNYYNVDRCVSDIEICVPNKSLLGAVAALVASSDRGNYTYTPDPWNKDARGIFNAYKVDHPRLLCKTKNVADSGSPIHVCVLPDTLFEFQPLAEALIPQGAHLRHSAYSDHALEYMSSRDDPLAISKLNFPRLRPLFNAFLRHFVKSGCKDYNAAMLAESLVDGMDLDVEWCEINIPADRLQELEFAKKLVATKAGRLDYRYPDGVTLFLKTKEDAQRMRLVPGRDIQKAS